MTATSNITSRERTTKSPDDDGRGFCFTPAGTQPELTLVALTPSIQRTSLRHGHITVDSSGDVTNRIIVFGERNLCVNVHVVREHWCTFR